MGKVTTEEIVYSAVPYGRIAIIPQGTPVILAANQPKHQTNGEQYWAEPWDGMSDGERSWYNNYGFLLRGDEVTDE